MTGINHARISRSPHWTVAVLLALVPLAACDDTTGVDGPGTVAFNMSVSGGDPMPGFRAPGATEGSSGPARVAGPPLVLAGTNGTLTIEEIRLIVAEVELEGDDDVCEAAGGGDDCADFNGPPRFLDLPLDGQPIEAFVSQVPPGTYKELEFEIEDLEDDEVEAEFQAEILALRGQILDEFPEWPDKATALVVGSFESSQGDVIAFRVFLEAEIEIERDLIPNLVVSDDTPVTDLTVDLRVDVWFKRSDGSLLPLYLYDYDQTGEVLEFEFEMEDGFTEIEIG